ncbi:UNKNOWN [Stylonychia lemnae]|uniref:Uncharacterized protein n=1 Tax=Stylonychia lemnae TaxID=5949 RepID=A0A077ZX57_STYLE|nr:UNKNOWN [Stylonychia lemnae]|eukprot:CDW73111.1 UNKNOWN [Stylonychia lemnae]
MKGERTHQRFGINTNKSIRYNISEYTAKQFEQEIEDEIVSKLKLIQQAEDNEEQWELKVAICDLCKQQMVLMREYHEYSENQKKLKALKSKQAYEKQDFDKKLYGGQCRNCVEYVKIQRKELQEEVDKSERKLMSRVGKTQQKISRTDSDEKVTKKKLNYKKITYKNRQKLQLESDYKEGVLRQEKINFFRNKEIENGQKQRMLEYYQDKIDIQDLWKQGLEHYRKQRNLADVKNQKGSYKKKSYNDDFYNKQLYEREINCNKNMIRKQINEDILYYNEGKYQD